MRNEWKIRKPKNNSTNTMDGIKTSNTLTY